MRLKEIDKEIKKSKDLTKINFQVKLENYIGVDIEIKGIIDDIFDDSIVLQPNYRRSSEDNYIHRFFIFPSCRFIYELSYKKEFKKQLLSFSKDNIVFIKAKITGVSFYYYKPLFAFELLSINVAS
jgi:hypothetical protein